MDDKNNTGNWNTGNWNTGRWNTGDYNTGDWNTGRWNTGDYNTGNWNTGDWNTGDWNTGRWNTGHRNTGFFNTRTPELVMVFDNAMVDRDEFLKACPAWLYGPSPTTWVSTDNMTDAEKYDHPEHETTEGYLRVNDWQEEWRKSYEEASEEDIQKVRDLPGFDAAVFEKITGLDLTQPKITDRICVDGVWYKREN